MMTIAKGEEQENKRRSNFAANRASRMRVIANTSVRMIDWRVNEAGEKYPLRKEQISMNEGRKYEGEICYIASQSINPATSFNRGR